MFTSRPPDYYTELDDEFEFHGGRDGTIVQHDVPTVARSLAAAGNPAVVGGLDRQAIMCVR